MQTAAELKETLDAQIAYGKWNVAGTARRLREAQLREMSPARRALSIATEKAIDCAMFCAGWALFAAFAYYGIGGLF